MCASEMVLESRPLAAQDNSGLSHGACLVQTQEWHCPGIPTAPPWSSMAHFPPVLARLLLHCQVETLVQEEGGGGVRRERVPGQREEKKRKETLGWVLVV